VTEKPIIAIIANEQTPYRLHLHRRIVREVLDIELWSLFTHELASSPWCNQNCPEVRPVIFGRGESSTVVLSIPSLWREWAKGGTIIQWLVEYKAQAVVLFGYNDTARLRLLLWCRRNNVPCFLFGDSNIKGDNATGLRRLVKSVYVPWIIRQATGVFHCGTLGHEYFLKYGACPDRLYPFPYEPDYQIFAQPDAERVRAMQLRFGIERHRRRFLFVGRLVRDKRPDLLLDAFVRITGFCPDWDLIMVGDGMLRPELEHNAAILNGRVAFTGFIQDPVDISALYALCHVFVLPSDYEPWGIVVSEAAAAGLAIIASSAVGSAADLLETGVNGILFDHHNPASLSAALKAVTMNSVWQSMQRESKRILMRWRAQSDPIMTLRTVLKPLLARQTGT